MAMLFGWLGLVLGNRHSFIMRKIVEMPAAGVGAFSGAAYAVQSAFLSVRVWLMSLATWPKANG